MTTRDDLIRIHAAPSDTVLRTREAIRRWLARGKVERRKRRAMEQISSRLRRDVGFDRPER